LLADERKACPFGVISAVGAAGSKRSQEGWYVPVEYWTLDNQLRPKNHIAILRPDEGQIENGGAAEIIVVLERDTWPAHPANADVHGLGACLERECRTRNPGIARRPNDELAEVIAALEPDGPEPRVEITQFGVVRHAKEQPVGFRAADDLDQ
jgi:hypothetical protein